MIRVPFEELRKRDPERAALLETANLAAIERNAMREAAPVDERAVERVARALIEGVEQQTDGSWPVLSTPSSTVGLVDEHIDFIALARVVVSALTAGDVREGGE